jgi:hypothetical protein
MAAAPDPIPAALTAEGKKSFEPDTKQAGFVSTAKDSSDSLPLSEAELKANPFLDSNVAQTYRLIYEKAEYECREAFDPDLTWTSAEEKRVKWKMDLTITMWSMVMFFALNVDRGNLKQAIADNLLDDLGLTTDHYNTGERMRCHRFRNLILLTFCRQHHLLCLFSGRRITLSIDLKEDRT